MIAVRFRDGRIAVLPFAVVRISANGKLFAPCGLLGCAACEFIEYQEC